LRLFYLHGHEKAPKKRNRAPVSLKIILLDLIRPIAPLPELAEGATSSALLLIGEGPEAYRLSVNISRPGGLSVDQVFPSLEASTGPVLVLPLLLAFLLIRTPLAF
jgi:hypothetical protein